MDQPIPSYLLALAVGDLSFRPLGERSGVYAEPSVVEAAAWEFADIEAMMTAAEDLYGPYRWERFDILVLPPSFPFGGMENPRLTFATPTLLAGDRSLVSTVAHELAHSWSGNLVTNATWNDIWLNEGFTVYFELRIMEELEGREYSEMLAQLGQQNLRRTVEELGPASPLTRLHTELGSADDPDETFSDIPYEKGYFFLRLLEETVGRERFDDFLREYFDTYAFQSIDTATFLNYLRLHLIEGDQTLEETLGIDGWVYGPGLPTGCPPVHATAFDAVDRELAHWTAGRPAGQLKTEGWNTQQWLYFLSQLPKDLTTGQLADLDLAFAFTQRGNAEILCAWLLHAIAHDYQPGLAAADEFLNRVGRRKFLEPLYKKLAETPAGRQRAREIYRRARSSYHPTAVAALDEILGWEEG
jgi:aminopeptidase N